MEPRGDFGSSDEGVESENSQGVESDIWYDRVHGLKTPTCKNAISSSSPDVYRSKKENIWHTFTPVVSAT